MAVVVLVPLGCWRRWLSLSRDWGDYSPLTRWGDADADAGLQEFGEIMKQRVKLISDFLAIGSSADEVEKAGTATTAAGTAEATQPDA